MPRRGKRTAVVTLVAGAVVGTTGGWLARPRLVEEWYLLRLDSDDDAVRLNAANRLAERRCLRAILHLMELIEEESRERALVISKSTIGDDPWIRFTPRTRIRRSRIAIARCRRDACAPCGGATW